MPKFREGDEDTQDQVEDEDGIPEKFRGKSRKEIAASYAEAERLMHDKAAEAAKYRTMLDMQDVQNSKGETKVSGQEATSEKPASGSDLKDVLTTYARAAYTAAMQDSVTLFEVREGLRSYLDQHPHLKKANRLFQSAVQDGFNAAKGNNSKTLYDVLEEARTSVESAIKEAGGSVGATPSRGRLLEGGESVESRSAVKRRAAAKEEDDDNSLEGYLAERNTRRSPSL